jgi:hypothetical protein
MGLLCHQREVRAALLKGVQQVDERAVGRDDEGPPEGEGADGAARGGVDDNEALDEKEAFDVRGVIALVDWDAGVARGHDDGQQPLVERVGGGEAEDLGPGDLGVRLGGERG